jgi:hypothetical protein
VLPLAVSCQGFQVVAGGNLKIGQDQRIVQGQQPTLGHGRYIDEFSPVLPVEQPLGFLAGERPDHVLSIPGYTLYVKRISEICLPLTIRSPLLHQRSGFAGEVQGPGGPRGRTHFSLRSSRWFQKNASVPSVPLSPAESRARSRDPKAFRPAGGKLSPGRWQDQDRALRLDQAWAATL